MRAKPWAQTLLTGAGGAPLLVIGKRGAGRVAVFSSDLKGIWSQAWLRSDRYPRFWRRLVRALLPEAPRGLPTVHLFDRGSTLELEIRYPSSEEPQRTPEVRLKRIGSPEAPLSVHRVAPGTFGATIPAPGAGAFLVTVRPRPLQPRDPPIRATLARPYAAELDPGVLQRGRQELATLAASRLLPLATPAALTAPATRSTRTIEELWPWSLMAFGLLWLLGLLLRRLPWGALARSVG